jgi:hypothetical protein
MNERFGVDLDGWPARMRQRETRHFQTKNAMRGGTISPLSPRPKRLPNNCQGIAKRLPMDR